MKLRMKKMPRPLDLRRFSGASGSATSSRLEPLPLVDDADDQLAGARRPGEGELDGHQLVGVLAVAVLDGVDDRLAHGDADPVDGVFVQAGELADVIADDLHEIQHLEVAVDLQPDRAASTQHARHAVAGAVKRRARTRDGRHTG